MAAGTNNPDESTRAVRLRGLRMVCAVLVVAVVAFGCGSQVEQASSSVPEPSVSGTDAGMQEASGPTSVPAGEDADTAAMDQALAAYVACVRPKLDGYIRVDFDRFLGVSGEYGLPDGRNDEHLMQETNRECEESSGFAGLMDVFVASHTPTRDDIREIASEITSCIRSAGIGYADEFEQLDPQDADELTLAIREIPMPTETESRTAFLDCIDGAMYGDRIDF